MARRQEKEFQTFCYQQVHRGLIKRANGSWNSATTSQMDLDMQAGYKLAGRLKRAKKQKGASAT